MDECLIKLSNYKEITVWVLNSNLDAISGYQAYGFRNNGYKKSVLVSENYQLDEVCL
ncbi:MAG: hypothetical protein RBT45_04800 [Acholeplasmataceae bacterium]|jgi:hypothetical protein|nr:hypothetical protein [Acholeplasmataceae bacterium]